MKIQLKTSFENGKSEIETSSRTLKDLLYELSKQYPAERFYNKDWEDVTITYTVELNGKLYDSLPRELDTKLNDGDVVEIYQSGEFEED
ncbi:MAG: MoaD/ThiS family protein [Dehalococcoidales bacterium]|nr:MoaD/ThiS family protein [Dehalococcoidales bacterium]